MAILDEEAFRAHLKNGKYSRVYFIYGEDLFLKEFYLKQLTDSVCDERFAVFNMHKFNDESTLDDIFLASEALPMMSEYSCVLLRDYNLAALNADDSKDFLEAMSSLPETTVLIIACMGTQIDYNPKKSDKWKKFIDEAIQYGTVVNISHRSPSRIATLLTNKAKDRGTSIDKDTALYFIERAGDDLQILLNEFNKLCAYSCSQPITRQMIDETVTKTVEASVFDIFDSIISGQNGRAYEIMDELLKNKTEIPSIIGALALPYIDLYRCKVYKRAGKSSADVATDFQYGNRAFTLKNAFAKCSSCTLNELKTAIDLLSQADIRSKSSSASDRLLLDELFARLISIHTEENDV